MPINKVFATCAEAVADIPSGATIMVAGFGAGFPKNLVAALTARKVRDLIVIGNAPHATGLGPLIEARQVKKAIISFGSAPGQTLLAEELYLAGELEIEMIPQGTLAERIRAGGAGIGGFYVPVGVGTHIETGKEKRVLEGKEYLLELPLKADYALLKAHQADTLGNLVYRRAARNFNPIMAPAATVTIVETEHLVRPEDLDPERIGTPGVFVNRIVEVAGGGA